MRRLALLFMAIALAFPLFAEDALISLELQDDDSFMVEGSRSIRIYGLSERMKPVVQKSRNRKLSAASYFSEIKIRTSSPKIAIQKILRQISQKTGMELGAFHDSRASASIAPLVLVMAVGEKSVWHLLLIPQSDGSHALTVTCVMDE